MVLVKNIGSAIHKGFLPFGYMVGWTPNREASSAMLSSFLMAAIVSFALNSSEYFLRIFTMAISFL